MAINRFNYGYLSRLGGSKKIACQTISNHNKGRLGCVPGLLLKRYHKTSMVNLNNISSSMYFIRNNQTMKHVYQNTQALLDISIISQ